MKTRIIHAFVGIIYAALCSCSSHDSVLYTLSVPHDEVILGADECSFNIGVVGNAEFNASVQDAHWLEVTNIRTESNSITLKASANTTENSRSATIDITNLSSNEKLMVKVLQTVASDKFFDEKEYILWSCDYEFKLPYSHSSLSSIESNVNWIKVNKTKDATSGVEVTSLVIEPNPASEDRTAEVTIISSIETKDVSVCQLGNNDHIFLGIAHNGKTLDPIVTGRMNSKEPRIDVDWGDGIKGPIEDDGHTYTTEGTHNATIDCWGINTLTINSLGNATELTFGRRK